MHYPRLSPNILVDCHTDPLCRAPHLWPCQAGLSLASARREMMREGTMIQSLSSGLSRLRRCRPPKYPSCCICLPPVNTASMRGYGFRSSDRPGRSNLDCRISVLFVWVPSFILSRWWKARHCRAPQSPKWLRVYMSMVPVFPHLQDDCLGIVVRAPIRIFL